MMMEEVTALLPERDTMDKIHQNKEQHQKENMGNGLSNGNGNGKVKPQRKHVLIIGGGVASVSLAYELRRIDGKARLFDLTILQPTRYCTLQFEISGHLSTYNKLTAQFNLKFILPLLLTPDARPNAIQVLRKSDVVAAVANGRLGGAQRRRRSRCVLAKQCMR